MGSNPKYIKSPGDYNKYTDYTFFDFWNQNKNKYKISKARSQEIIRKFGELVHEEMLSNPDGFRLPYRVGTLIIAGVETDCKDVKRSTKEKRLELRNLKTNKVVFFPSYIFGKSRGACYLSLLWRFKSTVPLRRKIKERVDLDMFRHWFVLRKKSDLPRYDIPADIKRIHKR